MVRFKQGNGMSKEENKLSFNSTMVRFKLTMATFKRVVEQLFQFHDGSIQAILPT